MWLSVRLSGAVAALVFLYFRMYSADALKTKALVRSAFKALLPTDSARLRYSGFGTLGPTLFTRLITKF